MKKLIALMIIGSLLLIGGCTSQELADLRQENFKAMKQEWNALKQEWNAFRKEWNAMNKEWNTLNKELVTFRKELDEETKDFLNKLDDKVDKNWEYFYEEQDRRMDIMDAEIKKM